MFILELGPVIYLLCIANEKIKIRHYWLLKNKAGCILAMRCLCALDLCCCKKQHRSSRKHNTDRKVLDYPNKPPNGEFIEMFISHSRLAPCLISNYLAVQCEGRLVQYVDELYSAGSLRFSYYRRLAILKCKWN